MPQLTRQDDVWTLDLGDDENRFGHGWLDEVGAHLDQVEAAGGPAALVTTGTGKFFSNGLDLDWLLGHPEDHAGYVARVHRLLARVLTLPVPTVAAVNGHAFGAGAMLAVAHDQRVMRTDRGFICLPEVHIGIPFTPGMAALLQGAFDPRTARTAMFTGHRYGGPEALAAGIVDAVAEADALRASATALVAPHTGTAGATLGSIKAVVHARASAALLSD
ncbi:enoyl-CoA hydratase/isomerase family protein [Modestobacter sp. I12A-02628]|uniref:Enoyl-CoA hydratase/isomerase family protein n=1 Tax=Goekera deserti TaxID=2497753 RepID=A0A7K3WBL0_9ACTN|nr:enoyl-CoA hydratase/isomerase family protein [Goekera deserti]MPQ97383.1 enoyl-CoA hydratase/isomerase family protein [Goekera deserti]NDI48016.1 enoyl-CoA hydratase/isomerase family protein [Goekera deserti]NEL53764.1 enoyl-CoA hydratase/isomerase family protein [Goekera deserti]